MDNTMFMAFAMEQDDYDQRVADCAEAVLGGTCIKAAADTFNVDCYDVLALLDRN